VLAAASVAGKPCWKSLKQRGQSRGIKTGPGRAAHLSDPEGAVGELGVDVSLPSTACIVFQDWRALAKPVLNFGKFSFVPEFHQFRFLQIISGASSRRFVV